MSGKGIGVANVATGISLFPDTRDSRPLFILALSLLASGIIVLATTVVLARKRRKSAANA